MNRRNRNLSILAGVLLLAAVAIPAAAKVKGIKSGETVAATCDTITKDSTCAELVVTDPAKKGDAVKALKQLCKGAKAGGSCKTAGQVGTCRIMKDIINHYYSKGPKNFTVDSAKEQCEKDHGHWVD
ncbi:MAG TPA: hypothetical protein VGQ83_41735 [Polyangia bacterium]|jgi:hypothetical protein